MAAFVQLTCTRIPRVEWLKSTETEPLQQLGAVRIPKAQAQPWPEE